MCRSLVGRAKQLNVAATARPARYVDMMLVVEPAEPLEVARRGGGGGGGGRGGEEDSRTDVKEDPYRHQFAEALSCSLDVCQILSC